jgi:hypothetical protein
MDLAWSRAAALCPVLPADQPGVRRGGRRYRRGDEWWYVDPDLIRATAWDALAEVGLHVWAESWEVEQTGAHPVITVHFRAVLVETADGGKAEIVAEDAWSICEPFEKGDLSSITHAAHGAVRMIETRFLEVRLRIRRKRRGEQVEGATNGKKLDPDNVPAPLPAAVDLEEDIPDWPEPEPEPEPEPVAKTDLGEPWARLCKVEGHPSWELLVKSATGHKPPLVDADEPAKVLAEIERLLALRSEAEARAVAATKPAPAPAPAPAPEKVVGPAQDYLRRFGGGVA